MADKTAHTVKIHKDEEDFKKLGDRIKAIRISQGFTSSEAFANERGLQRSQYAKYETGSNLTYHNLLKVIRALRIPISEFFNEEFD